MSGSFDLTLQTLSGTHQVLLVGHVAGVRNGTGWFNTADVNGLFEDLRVPAPPNTSAVLGRLKESRFVIKRRDSPPWSLTPQGRQKTNNLLSSVDPESIEARLVGSPGAEFAHALHSVIPPTFAPTRWRPGIARLLERYPFERNVFLMTRFPDKTLAGDPLPETIEAIRDVTSAHSLHLHVASDRQIDDDLLGNVGAYLWACQYGIGLLENRRDPETGINSNVLIELGSMLVTGRRCAILKDCNSPSPPSDLSGQIYKSVNLDEIHTVRSAVHHWIADDLGLGPCDECA